MRHERDLVADFPAEPVGGRAADDRAGARLQPRLHLLRRQDLNSGYMRMNSSGSTGIWPKKFFGSL